MAKTFLTFCDPEFANYLKQRDFSKPLNLVLNNARHLEIRVMPYSDKQG
ncbi:hypothetical protein [Klebsiella pneumoniae]|nr:hypothetical protein [Klebsiella pneumoniae]